MISSDLWDALSAREPHDVERCARAHPAGDGSYELDVLDERYRIDPRERNIVRVRPAAPAKPSFWLWLASAVYLVDAKDIEPAGEWVNPQQFPGGAGFFRGQHEIPVAKIIDCFDGRRSAFEAACRQLGGTPLEHADVAFSFAVFPRVPVAVLLWLRDEEFPARASMLVDRTAHEHLPLDALWSALNVVQDALVAAAAQ